MAAWFQVNCSHCTRALQVQAGVGVHPVKCATCSKVFNVHIHESFLPAHAASTRATRKPKVPRVLPASLVAYNVFQKVEHARVVQEHPSLPFHERRRLVDALWRTSSSNPNNGGDGAPLDGPRGAATNDAGRPAPPSTAPSPSATNSASVPAASPTSPSPSPSPVGMPGRGLAAARAAAARVTALDPTAAARPDNPAAAAPNPPADEPAEMVVEEEEESESDDELTMREVDGRPPRVGRRGFAAIHAGTGRGRGRGTTQVQGAGAGRGRGRGKTQMQGAGRGRGRGTTQVQGVGTGRGRGRGTMQMQGTGRGRGSGTTQVQGVGTGRGRGRGRGSYASAAVPNVEEEERDEAFITAMADSRKRKAAQRVTTFEAADAVADALMYNGVSINPIFS